MSSLQSPTGAIDQHFAEVLNRIKHGDHDLKIGALVHYGVTTGDGATLAANAFLMKGAEVPPFIDWGENPAQELRDVRQKSTPEPRTVIRPVGRVTVPTTGGQSQ